MRFLLSLCLVTCLMTLMSCGDDKAVKPNDTNQVNEPKVLDKPDLKDVPATSVIKLTDEQKKVLLDSRDEKVNQKAPAVFEVEFETSQGSFVIEVTRELSPLGADRFYNLANNGYFNGCRFFRVVKGFMAQFGMHGTPEIHRVWSSARIKDEPVRVSNKRGTISYAKPGIPNARSNQFFINYRNNRNLDGMGFAPFGRVVKGMEVVDRLYGDYGDAPPHGRGPNQGQIIQQGDSYLDKFFPKLDVIYRARIKKKDK